jgi:hypothetical protein
MPTRSVLGGLSGRLHAPEDGGLLQADANAEGESDQEDGDEERHAPTPILVDGIAETNSGDQDDPKGNEEADGRRRLDPRRVEAALVVWRVFCHVNRGAAVLAAEG